jgi:hypothetical protein
MKTGIVSLKNTEAILNAMLLPVGMHTYAHEAELRTHVMHALFLRNHPDRCISYGVDLFLRRFSNTNRLPYVLTKLLAGCILPPCDKLQLTIKIAA